MCDYRGEPGRVGVCVDGVVTNGNVESLGVFTQGSRTDDGASARGRMHQGARER